MCTVHKGLHYFDTTCKYFDRKDSHEFVRINDVMEEADENLAMTEIEVQEGTQNFNRRLADLPRIGRP